MTDLAHVEDDRAWQRFIIQHGDRALATDLASVLHRRVEDILRVRRTGACTQSGRRKGFRELFWLWHGRDPGDEDWPTPRKAGHGQFEWQGPELALLASLVGRLGNGEIGQILTERLRRLTGDPGASRSPASVQIAINRIGMQSKDVLGGITTDAAAREIRSRAIVHQAIRNGDIKALRVGRRWVIPHDNWAVWKAGRVLVPEGYVPLVTLKGPLSIRSDKLSEFARLGYVPTAVRCNPCGTGRHSTRFGTWYIDARAGRRLIADRRAGRPMPWHGKPLAANLRTTFRLWQERQHPSSCTVCAGIWGAKNAPKSFEDYTERYPPLAHGAKRHLTLQWSPGLTVAEVARKAGVAATHVRRAVANGTLNGSNRSHALHITRTDATRWISHGCPAGDTQHSWISIATARKRYLFTKRELDTFVAEGRLQSRVGRQGAMRGIVYVPRRQCASLRERIGFSENEAARRAGVTIPALRALIAGVDWRAEDGIPLSTLQAAIKRIRSRPGYTLDQAAEALGRPISWIEERVKDGTVRLLQRPWDPEHLYLSEPTVQRLRGGATNTKPPTMTDTDWLQLGSAALEAGVTTTTILKWADQGRLTRVRSPTGWRYPRDAVRTRARDYWRQTRFKRAVRPSWLQAESCT